MKNKRAKDLLDKYKTGTLKSEENAQLETWYLHLSDTEEGSLNESDMGQRLDAVWKKLNYNRTLLKIKSFSWMRIATAAIITIFIGTLFYLNRKDHSPITGQVKYSSNIMPGGNKATLTLANGQKVILSDLKSGAIIKQGGIIINKSSDGNVVYQTTGSKTSSSVLINTLSTPRGGQYHLTLADGTNVWLNSGSTITNLNVVVLHSDSWTYTPPSVNFSYNMNKVTSLPVSRPILQSGYVGYLQDNPGDYLFVYRWAGLDKTGQPQIFNHGDKMASDTVAFYWLNLELKDHPEAKNVYSVITQYATAIYNAKVDGYKEQVNNILNFLLKKEENEYNILAARNSEIYMKVG